MATPEEKRWAKEARSRRQALKKASAPSSTNLFQARIRRTELNHRPRSSAWIWFFLFAGVVFAAGAWWWQRSPQSNKLIPAAVSAPQADLSATLQASSAPVVTPVAVAIAPVVTPNVMPAVDSSSATSHALLPDNREWHATTSGVTDSRRLVIKSRGALRSLWKEMERADELPRINFNEHWVAGVFLGPKSGAGYDVQITTPHETDKELTVPYHIVEPQAGIPLSSDTVHPWQLRVIPRSDKPVHFIDESLTRSGVSH